MKATLIGIGSVGVTLILELDDDGPCDGCVEIAVRELKAAGIEEVIPMNGAVSVNLYATYLVEHRIDPTDEEAVKAHLISVLQARLSANPTSS